MLLRRDFNHATSRAHLFADCPTFAKKVVLTKGANPGELPIQLPAKFDLAINANTSKELGLAVPSSLLGGRGSRRGD